MSILIVDDFEPARFVRRRVLEGAGYTVRMADCAAAAQTVSTAEQDIALVLLDLQLPDGDGWTVCERLKRDRPDVAVVMITSIYKSATSRLEAFEVGADAYLVEPTSSVRLLDTVAQCLGRVSPGAACRATVCTDRNGRIIGVDPAGARLLNFSARGVIGRSLLPSFGADRPAAIEALRCAASGQIVQGEGLVRPRERRAVRVGFEVTPEHGDVDALMWTFQIREPARSDGARGRDSGASPTQV